MLNRDDITMIHGSFTNEDTLMTEKALKIFSSTWTAGLIIQMATGQCRPREFLKSNPGLSAKVLQERLSMLNRHGFITRESFTEFPPRVEYRLTQDGLAAITVFEKVKGVFKLMS